MSRVTKSPEKIPLPAAPVLAEQLLTRSLREVAASYGVTPSAVCIRLRRAGMARGKPKPRGGSRAVPAVPHLSPVPSAAPPEPGAVERIAWVTEFGARVTLARFTILKP